MSKRAASQELERDPLMARKFAHLKITSRHDLGQAQDFALSILENRDLAKYVRNVTLNYSLFARPFPAQALPYTATTKVELAKEAQFRAAIAEQNWEADEAIELLKRLMTVESPGFGAPSSHELLPDAVVALLLPILPNVEKWTVGDISRPQFVGKAIQRAKDGIFGIISVSNIELLAHTYPYSDGAWAAYRFPSFKIFQNLPLLESISGKGIGGTSIGDSGCYDEIPSKASAVHEIHLRDCELPTDCLAKLLDFSTGLRSFKYRFGGRASVDGGISLQCSPELAKALTPHTSTMRSLDIDIEKQLIWDLQTEIRNWEQSLKNRNASESESDDESGDDDEETSEPDDEEESGDEEEDEDEDNSDAETLNSEESKASATRLKRATESDPYFPNLTHLRIGIKLASRFAELLGKTLAEWLPASLEELEIVGYRPHESEDITKQVTEVVRRRDVLLPNLKTLNGVDQCIEIGTALKNEEDYVASGESGEDSSEEQ